MSTENSGWVTVKESHYGGLYEKADGSVIATSMWDMHNGGLRWSLHIRGTGQMAEKTITHTPSSLKATLSELITVAKSLAVKEGKYELGAKIRDLEKVIEDAVTK